MRLCRASALAIGVLWILAACVTAPSPTAPAATPTLIPCDLYTPATSGAGSILPPFEPSYPCELENVSHHVDFCMVYASPQLAYPCSRTESVQEFVLGEGSRTVLIQREMHASAGCWHGISWEVRSLRVCDRESGASTVPAERLRGNPVPSPDKVWFAFVSATNDSPLTTHIFRIRSDGTEGVLWLDSQPFPHDQVVGANILRWSKDAEWLEVSLWDGAAGGYYEYRLRTDGSGTFEALP